MAEEQAVKHANDDDGSNTQSVVCSILQFLDDEMKNPVISRPETKESLEVAMQCLETAFGVGLNNPNFRKPKTSLVELMRQSEVKSADVSASASSSTSSTQTSNASGSNSSTPTTQGARGLHLPFAGVSFISTGPEYIKPPMASEEAKILADEAKNKGNDAMRDSNIADALEFYTKAIELDGNNATFFCNRAAAYIKLEDFEKAIRDCQIALQLTPDYARAYGRMGIAYATQGRHIDAVLCFNKALEFDRENETYQRNIRISTQMVLQDLPTAHEQFSTSANAPAIMANAGQIFGQIASQFAQLPEMQETVTRVVSALRPSTERRGSHGGASAGGLNDLSSVGRAVAELIANHNENANPNSSFENVRGSDSDTRNANTLDQVENQPTTTATVADPDHGIENELKKTENSPAGHPEDS